MLYDRDFNTLTAKEQIELRVAENYKRNNIGNLGEISPDVMVKYHDLKPSASYHYESLFPNNHLNRDI